MGRCRKLALAAWGAALWLPGLLPAQIYTIHIPKSEVPARVELFVAGVSVTGGASATPATARVGDWELTVAFDPDRCEISCVYRRIREVTRWLPPAAEIRLYPNSGPSAILLDPAGLKLPAAAGRALLVPEQLCIPARRLLNAILVESSGRRMSSSTGVFWVDSAGTPQVTLPTFAHLRI